MLLKVCQSVDLRKPLFEAVAVAMVNVQLPVEEVIDKPEAPLVAKVKPVVEAYGIGKAVLSVVEAASNGNDNIF